MIILQLDGKSKQGQDAFSVMLSFPETMNGSSPFFDYEWEYITNGVDE